VRVLERVREYLEKADVLGSARESSVRGLERERLLGRQRRVEYERERWKLVAKWSEYGRIERGRHESVGVLVKSARC